MPSAQKANAPIPVSSGVSSCYIRKHLKRHSKPFGCTHDGCNKVFGAKNDWKRHENSQHHQLECWKCDIRCLPTPPGMDTSKNCGKCFFRKADFIKHLKMVHGNSDGWAIPTDQNPSTTGEAIVTIARTGHRAIIDIIGDCHIPKYHGGAFWCGFCEKVIKLDGKVGIEGWDKRFDHIAWHFEKDNLRVKDAWMRLDEPSPEDNGKEIGPASSRSKEGDETSDDDAEATSSLPKAQVTEPTSVLSNTQQQHNKSTFEGVKRWQCCKCNYGPYIMDLYQDCGHCKGDNIGEVKVPHKVCGKCKLLLE